MTTEDTGLAQRREAFTAEFLSDEHRLCTHMPHRLFPQQDWRDHCIVCNEDWPCPASLNGGSAQIPAEVTDGNAPTAQADPQ